MTRADDPRDFADQDTRDNATGLKTALENSLCETPLDGRGSFLYYTGKKIKWGNFIYIQHLLVATFLS